MGKNKASLIWPMSKQCTSCARATLRHLAAGLDWHGVTGQSESAPVKGGKTAGAT